MFRKIGKAAFSGVFSNAPAGSSQILHPERYFARQKPVLPDFPKLNWSEEQEVTEGSMGEFDHRVLLWQYIGRKQAEELASHLRGAQFRLTAGGRGQRPVLEYVSQWDSEVSAAAFFHAYKKVLAGKWKRCTPSSDTDKVFTGRGDNGFFVTHLNGNILVSVEGLRDPATWASLKASFPEGKKDGKDLS